jgi:hypothetical protein
MRWGQRQPAILEGELPGDIPENARKRVLVARALRPPPPSCSLSRKGLLATAELLRRLAAEGEGSNSTSNAVRWLAGPHLFFC